MENLYAMFQIREAVVHPQMFFKTCVLKNVTRKTVYQRLFLIKLQGGKGLQLYSKETPTQVFSCEIGEIFKNTFFYRTPLVAAFEIKNVFNFQRLTCGFTNNPNFIRFKWRLKKNHLPAKCVIGATEIRRMEIRL